MKPTPFQSKTTPWRVQLPASLFPDKKRKARYFASLEAATKFCSAVKKRGLAAVEAETAPAAAINEHAPLIMAAIAKLNGDPTRVFEAIEFFQKTRLNVKVGLFIDVIKAFAESRRGKVQPDVWRDDNSRLKKLVHKFGNFQIVNITEAHLDNFFDDLVGHTRSTHKIANVFFKWARKKGFIAINPMADIEPRERWNARKEIYHVETFSRMLRIAAGLEGCRPGEEPSRDFLPLLPWLVISGFCGLRSCEAFRTKITDDAIKWEDLKFHRNPPFVHIRHEVAKRTKRSSDKRNIETHLYVDAARAWLELVPQESEFIVTATERSLWKLKSEFQARTGIKFLGNALRNSFASYALTATKAGVGQLALEMGNSEAICKQFYVETLEPRTGAAWFGLRPDQPSNVVPMITAA